MDRQAWDLYNNFHFFCDTPRFQKLLARAELVRMIADVPGDIVDAGVYKGVSALQFAHILKTYRPLARGRVVAFDTFEAVFPHQRADEAKAVAGLYADYDPQAYERLQDALARLNLNEKVEIVRGDIVLTLPDYLERHPGFRISLLHCDLDAYAPTLATLKAAWARLVPGGIAAFDEYAIGVWGESDAVDEFFAGLNPRPKLKALPFAATPTAYCVKE